MDSKTIVMCVVALILGMLLANMLKSVCGCKTVEGFSTGLDCAGHELPVPTYGHVRDQGCSSTDCSNIPRGGKCTHYGCSGDTRVSCQCDVGCPPPK